MSKVNPRLSVLALLFASLCFSADISAQNSQPKRSATTSSKVVNRMATKQQKAAPNSQQRPQANGPVKEDFLFSFDRLPTFADHDLIAARKENNLPIKFPVLPIYSVSEELPGYVDVLRRVSLITYEGLIKRLDATYTTPWDLVRDYSDRSVINAEIEESITLKGQDIVQSNAGVQFMVDRFEFNSDGELWGRVVLSTAEETPEGVRYIKVMIHYPSEFTELVTNELAYYVEQAVVNPLKK